MKKTIVELTRLAEKQLKKLPQYIVISFDQWVETIEIDGYENMQKIKGYRDHSLLGIRKGQRSSSITKAYRVIYEVKEDLKLKIIEVQEVNKHEYKK